MLLPPITAVQQPGTSRPPSRLKRSSAGVIWMCRASSTNNSCPLPWSSTVVSSQWIGWWFSHACSATAESRLQSPFGLSDVDLAAAAGDTIIMPHWIVYQEVMYPSPWSTSSGESARTFALMTIGAFSRNVGKLFPNSSR